MPWVGFDLTKLWVALQNRLGCTLFLINWGTESGKMFYKISNHVKNTFKRFLELEIRLFYWSAAVLELARTVQFYFFSYTPSILK